MTSLQEIERVSSIIRGEYRSIILFGSYSRGDYKDNSDIDVLQVTSKPGKSYAVGQYNISVYSIAQLKKMAGEGNLFVLHLITEGKLLSGDSNFLQELKSSYKRISNYDAYRQELLKTAQLLDATEFNYNRKWQKYNALLCYLLRSYLYSYLIEQNKINFSTDFLYKQFNDFELKEVLNLKKQQFPSYASYNKGVNLFENYAEIQFTNPYTSEAELYKNLDEGSLSKSLTNYFIKEDSEGSTKNYMR